MLHKKRLQSAMEYLMTYGWAILIIAVVLGALFGLGFFSAANLAPKVTAGACQVYRPQGPGTTSFINLEGTCNNELPQYVAMFTGNGGGYINVTSNPSLNFNNAFSVSLWFNRQGTSTWTTLISKDSWYAANGWVINMVHSATMAPAFGAGGVNYNQPPNAGFYIESTVGTQLNTWYNLIVTFNSGTGTMYLNGAKVASGSFSPAISNNALVNLGIGNENLLGNPWNGYITDVTIYNTSLTANEVTALYDEGIGGVPLLPQNLAGWWPLNGNANDYSGNLNNGGSVGKMAFTSSWTSGYTAP